MQTLQNYVLIFYRDLSYGKGAPIPLKDTKIANIEKTEPWDGKDGEVNITISTLCIDTCKEFFKKKN